jgi:ketosteroid isomerase-like protein
MDIEPSSRTIAVGWDAVKKFTDGNFLVFAELKKVLTDGPHVQIKGDLARSMGIAMITFKLKNGTTASANVFLNYVFEKHDGAWLLVSRFVAPVPK